MSRLPDLVRDTRLNTSFQDNFTIHYHDDSDDENDSRSTWRSEYWQATDHLGRGGCGDVWLQECIRGKRGYERRAVKVISRLRLKDKKDSYMAELEAIAKFSQKRYSKCFVKLLGWYDTDSSLYIAMEYFPLGDLQNYLAKRGPMHEADAREISFQVLQGLAYMHREGFAHRDIKPGNVLIRSQPPKGNWWVKISDFGISKRVEKSINALSSVKGTIPYMAPELLWHEPSSLIPINHQASDMWALGEMAYRILTQTAAFPTQNALVCYLINTDLFPSEELSKQGASSDAASFIRSLMEPRPEKRLASEKAMEHAWVASFNRTLISTSSMSTLLSISSTSRQPAPNLTLDPWATVPANGLVLAGSQTSEEISETGSALLGHSYPHSGGAESNVEARHPDVSLPTSTLMTKVPSRPSALLSILCHAPSSTSLEIATETSSQHVSPLNATPLTLYQQQSEMAEQLVDTDKRRQVRDGLESYLYAEESVLSAGSRQLSGLLNLQAEDIVNPAARRQQQALEEQRADLSTSVPILAESSLDASISSTSTRKSSSSPNQHRYPRIGHNSSLEMPSPIQIKDHPDADITTGDGVSETTFERVFGMPYGRDLKGKGPADGFLVDNQELMVDYPEEDEQKLNQEQRTEQLHLQLPAELRPEFVETDSCMQCRTPPTSTNGRYFCQNCAKCFDDNCSSERPPLPPRPVRVDDECIATRTQETTEGEDLENNQRQRQSEAPEVNQDGNRSEVLDAGDTVGVRGPLTEEQRRRVDKSTTAASETERAFNILGLSQPSFPLYPDREDNPRNKKNLRRDNNKSYNKFIRECQENDRRIEKYLSHERRARENRSAVRKMMDFFKMLWNRKKEENS